MARRRTPSLDRRQDRTGIDRSSGIDALHRNNRAPPAIAGAPTRPHGPAPGADDTSTPASGTSPARTGIGPGGVTNAEFNDDDDAQLDVSARRNRGGFEPLGESARQRPDAGLARKSPFANQQAGRISGTIGSWERSVTVREQSATFRRHPRSGHPRQVTHVCSSFTRLGLPPNCPTAILPPSRRSIGSVDPERAGELSPTHTGTRLAAANRSSRSMAHRQSSTPVDSCR